MATPRLVLSNLLRHSRAIQTVSSSSSKFYSYFYDTIPFRNHTPQYILLPNTNLYISHFFSSTHGSESGNFDTDSVSTQSEVSELGFSSAEVGEGLVNISYADSILPVRALINLLDGYHDITGLPWWFVIVSSTMALRAALFPLLILQLRKLKRIAELIPKLPPPLPPPLSKRSYKHQFLLFCNEKRVVGCPSFLWFMAYISIQFPCFLLWMTSIRRMSLDHHTGFESGGTLWFQNLTELPNGVVGSIIPLLIAGLHFANVQNLTELPNGVVGSIIPLLIVGLHFANVQISFQTASAGKVTGLLGFLVKSYKFYLDAMTLPILLTGFYIPQGSSVYWLTNSSLNLIQLLCLNDPKVRHHLGLPDKGDSITAKDTHNAVALVTFSGSSHRQGNVRLIRNRSPTELVTLSVELLAKGHKERAMLLLRQALDKDPEHVRALIIMGQTLLQDGQLAEAIGHLEHAISTLLFLGCPTEAEEVDLLIVASQWVGSCYIQQGKYAEALVHFERLGRMKEPEDSRSKSPYYDGLVMLASALSQEGRKAEAVKHLRRAVAYSPSYKEYLEQLENEVDNFAADLVDSRRGDY